MSHIKNVQTFGKLKDFCTGYGGSYNPGQQNLQVKAMTTLWLNAQQVMEQLYAAQTTYDNATNQRELAFNDMRKACTRIISALEACGAHPLTVQDARTRVRKLWGSKPNDRAPLPSANAAPGATTRRAVGRDFVTMAEYFAKLVETVSAEANYQPNEPELSVSGLEKRLAVLHTCNESVYAAEVLLGTLRQKRNAVLYDGEDNVYSTARAAKQYVKAAFGPDSEQYRYVARLQFTKPLA